MSGRTLASRNTWVRIKRNWILYAMLMPAILYFVVFKVQSIMGMSLAFYDYRIVGENVFVGLKHFRDLFSTPMFWQIMGMSLMFLLLSALISIFLALLISRPIRTLHRSVKEQLAGDFAPEEEVDEITFLHSVYQSMLNSNRELTENSRIYQIRSRCGSCLLCVHQPLTAPTVRPVTKYFCRKG